ncbi:MAG: PAS domain S-box protein [Phycisphaerae bacterium]|nr:PAS domain S-box protein [Phycisphaerae bacterium]
MQANTSDRRLEVYERLVENSPNPFAVVDRGRTYRMANSTYLRMRKATRDQVIGRTVLDVLGREGFELARPYLEECLSGKVARYSAWFDYPDQGHRFMEVNYYPLFDEAGQVELVVVELHDATEQKRAEEALRQSEERYRLHFEQVSDVIYSLDFDERITSVSPSVERLTGYRTEELIGRTVSETGLLFAEDLRRMAANKARVRAGKRTMTEYRIRAKDGTIRWGRVSGGPLVKDGQIIGGIMVAHDITERKQAEEALRQLNAELEDRISIRTADLKTVSDDLLRAIRAVTQGRHCLSSESTGVVVKGPAGEGPQHATSAYSMLTRRERDVLQLLAEGKSVKDTAVDLGISTRTVETHRRNIVKKLDLHSIAELTKYAVREGITRLEK